MAVAVAAAAAAAAEALHPGDGGGSGGENGLKDRREPNPSASVTVYKYDNNSPPPSDDGTAWPPLPVTDGGNGDGGVCVGNGLCGVGMKGHDVSTAQSVDVESHIHRRARHSMPVDKRGRSDRTRQSVKETHTVLLLSLSRLRLRLRLLCADGTTAMVVAIWSDVTMV
jgi:hypothetical protein